MTRLQSCDVEKLRLVLEEASFSNASLRRTLPRAQLELELRQLLPRLNPEPLAQVVRTLNLRVIRQLEHQGSVDLALFLAVLAPICRGSWEARKQVRGGGVPGVQGLLTRPSGFVPGGVSGADQPWAAEPEGYFPG